MMSGNFVNGGDPVFSSGRLGNNHVQLTNYNYIHQKNCMRRPYSPIQAERSIMRDLLALQRSRSLRDPSTSPPSWKTNDRTGLECLMEQNPHHSMRRIRSPWLPPSSSSVVKPSTAEISNVEHNQNRMIRPMLGETVSSNHKPQAGKTRCKFAPQRCTQVLNIPPPKKMTRNRHAVRRVRQSMDSRRTRVHNESTSLEQYSMQHNYSSKGREEYDDDDGDEKMEGSEEATSNGCGILRNWSRIHHSGKTFLDKAGRSFACGISEPPIILTQRDTSVNAASDHSYGSIKSDSDVVPLLNDDTCGSQETGKHPFSNQDSYSGELGIFTNHDEHNNGSHKSLTQKYMPKTFKDVVGHNLIVQALTNAVQRKRVGLFYVFYGPQGTGKSSCARLFAKALNCVSLQLNRPCGACTSCVTYNLGKSRNIVEMSSPVGNFDFEKTLLASLSSQYMVFIIDDCDAFPFDFWHSISNIINRTRQHVVFLLVSSSSSHDHLPHLITSRCQKFFFPKLKDTDIICKLQLIAFKEGLQIDMDAIKLIASRSDGSARDAEMTLDQLSLIGQEISLNLVQELVGLVSNEKLIDLLDLALSANTVNTIKNLREIIEAGVEPIRLMSQLATIITDILAGSYILDQERLQRKFFRQSTLSKDGTEKLRIALRTLSESEKQLRVSNDKITWLTAALLQLAPDEQYMLPNSSTDNSFSNSPMVMNVTNEGDTLNNDNRQEHLCKNEKDTDNVNLRSPIHSAETRQANQCNQNNEFMDVEKIWIAVIENIQINTLKYFMHQEAMLTSISFGTKSADYTVELMLSSNVNKSKAESFKSHILKAFESVLGTNVHLEIRNGSWKETAADKMRSTSTNNVVKTVRNSVKTDKHVHCEKTKNEIVQILASPTRIQQKTGSAHLGEERYEPCHSCLPNQTDMVSMLGRKNSRKQPQRRKSVREKPSLARVIHKPEGCLQEKGWSRQKAISIAEKVEQENIKMESKSKYILCCWKASRYTSRKLLHLGTRTKDRRRKILTVMSCGRCCPFIKPPKKVVGS